MFIYNESKTPFEIQDGEGSIGLIHKNVSNKDYKRNVHVLTTKELITDEIKDKILSITETKEPIEIMNGISKSVYFCKKDLVPLLSICPDSDRNATILLISINMKLQNENGTYRRLKVTNIDNKDILLLSSGVGNDLVLMTSFSNKSRTLNIRLYDAETNRIFNYSFKKHNDGKITLRKKDRDRVVEPIIPIKIKSYIPNGITTAIVCYKQDKSRLDEVMKNIELKFPVNIIEITNKNMETELVKLKEDNIRAVTLFMDTNDIASEDSLRIYSRLHNTTRRHFNKIIILTNNQKTIRSKL